jgi:hypothetical protein
LGVQDFFFGCKIFFVVQDCFDRRLNFNHNEPTTTVIMASRSSTTDKKIEVCSYISFVMLIN